MADDVLADLAAEQDALDAVVASIADAAWDTPTPAPGWRVRDQIGHLAFFDEQAVLAATDPDAFNESVAALLADLSVAEAMGRQLTGHPLLARWRAARGDAAKAMAAVPEGSRLPWYGPPMSVRSFATARLMETWAHGTDVADALGTSLPATDRLRHICHLGYGTRSWSYLVRDREVPDGDVRVELALPSGTPWVAGPEHAADVVRGTALQFCLVVTQRRNVADTALVADGALAEEWLSIAQCFAGGPTLTSRFRV